MISVREKVKPGCELSYKLFHEEYGYDIWIDIYTFTTLIQLRNFLGGIHHCVTFFGKFTFDGNSNF